MGYIENMIEINFTQDVRPDRANVGLYRVSSSFTYSGTDNETINVSNEGNVDIIGKLTHFTYST